MPKTFLSFAAGMLLLAGSATAGELSDAQMDTVTAGANITAVQLATAVANYDVTTDANHTVNVEANTYTSTTATIVADQSAVGNSTSQSYLNVSAVNN